MIKIPKFIQDLQPYIPGKRITEIAGDKNLSQIVKMASNENPHGVSPLALAAIRISMENAFRYVDPSAASLVNVLAKHLNRNPEQIITAHGIDAILGYIITAFSDVGDEVLTSEGTFIGIYVNCNKHSRNLKKIPLDNYSYDLEAILKNIRERTKIIYLANPNNPTGKIIDNKQFDKFIQQVPDNILVILDEAYYEYAAEFKEYPHSLAYQFPNLIITRTFSKAFGMGGLRIGYAIANKNLISTLFKVKLPFEPNYLAQVGAEAAITDAAFLKLTLDANKQSLSLMRQQFKKLGIKQLQSYANFILMLMPSESYAEQFTDLCLNRGLILRHVKAFGISNGIRINSGNEKETEFAINVISEIYPQLVKQCMSEGINIKA